MSSNFGLSNTWANGLLVRPAYLIVSLSRILKNVRRLILENQEIAFTALETLEGYTPNTLVRFHQDSIHYGLETDFNANAIYITGKILTAESGSNMLRQVYQLSIIATAGAQRVFDDSYILGCDYLTGLFFILSSMPAIELVWGWPGVGSCINDYTKYPKVVIGETKEDPNLVAVQFNLGAVPQLIFNFTVYTMLNRKIS